MMSTIYEVVEQSIVDDKLQEIVINRCTDFREAHSIVIEFNSMPLCVRYKWTHYVRAVEIPS